MNKKIKVWRPTGSGKLSSTRTITLLASLFTWKTLKPLFEGGFTWEPISACLFLNTLSILIIYFRWKNSVWNDQNENGHSTSKTKERNHLIYLYSLGAIGGILFGLAENNIDFATRFLHKNMGLYSYLSEELVTSIFFIIAFCGFIWSVNAYIPGPKIIADEFKVAREAYVSRISLGLIFLLSTICFAFSSIPNLWGNQSLRGVIFAASIFSLLVSSVSIAIGHAVAQRKFGLSE